MSVRALELVGTICAVLVMILVLAFVGMYGLDALIAELVIAIFCILMGFLGIKLAEMES